MATRQLAGVALSIVALIVIAVAQGWVEIRVPLLDADGTTDETQVADDSRVVGGDSPFDSEETVVVIVYESTDVDNYTVEQRLAMDDMELYLRETLPGRWRRLDDDSPPAAENTWVAKALSLAPEDDRLPWLFVASPRGGVSAPLPSSVEELKKIVERYLP